MEYIAGEFQECCIRYVMKMQCRNWGKRSGEPRDHGPSRKLETEKC